MELTPFGSVCQSLVSILPSFLRSFGVGPRKIFEIQKDRFQKWGFPGLKPLFSLGKLPV